MCSYLIFIVRRCYACSIVDRSLFVLDRSLHGILHPHRCAYHTVDCISTICPRHSHFAAVRALLHIWIYLCKECVCISRYFDLHFDYVGCVNGILICRSPLSGKIDIKMSSIPNLITISRVIIGISVSDVCHYDTSHQLELMDYCMDNNNSAYSTFLNFTRIQERPKIYTLAYTYEQTLRFIAFRICLSVCSCRCADFYPVQFYYACINR